MALVDAQVLGALGSGIVEGVACVKGGLRAWGALLWWRIVHPVELDLVPLLRAKEPFKIYLGTRDVMPCHSVASVDTPFLRAGEMFQQLFHSPQDVMPCRGACPSLPVAQDTQGTKGSEMDLGPAWHSKWGEPAGSPGWPIWPRQGCAPPTPRTLSPPWPSLCSCRHTEGGLDLIIVLPLHIQCHIPADAP